jgi:hypothetical protein
VKVHEDVLDSPLLTPKVWEELVIVSGTPCNSC